MSKPKNLFPQMPQQVFDLCFQPVINAYGWPFLSLDQPTVGTRWEKFFEPVTLRQWSEFQWQHGYTTLSEKVLTPRGRSIIQQIVAENTLQGPTETATIKDHGLRFWSLMDYIRKWGKLPAPVVGVLSKDGLLILDGYIRLAALVNLEKAEGFELPMWRAFPQGSKLPEGGNTQSDVPLSISKRRA